MKATNIWNYIWIGTCLRYLQDTQSGFTLQGESYVLGNMNSFLSNLDSLGLHVTKRASYQLMQLSEEFSTKPKDYALSQDDARRVSECASEIRKTFEAETQGVFTYVVTDKRMSVEKLLNKVEGLFGPNTYEMCPPVARYDYSEAGKCIAFERPTAAAFHILRGTEAVVRLYYKRHMRPALKGLTWGQMTDAIRAKSKGKKGDPLILDQLDHIRRGFRNPTQHPDKTYEIHEVQDLFALCIDVVNRMISSISKKG